MLIIHLGVNYLPERVSCQGPKPLPAPLTSDCRTGVTDFWHGAGADMTSVS
jgi:hypothetical protein